MPTQSLNSIRSAAVQAQFSAQIGSLVGAAPTDLNTLAELAAAVSQKANSATTLAGYGITDGLTVGQVAAINGLATLDANGKLTGSQIPSITITDTFVVASQAAMLALSTAETGDVAVRTDLSKSFILQGTQPSTLSDWQELLTPTSGVTSVAGRTGAVTLAAADVSGLSAVATSGLYSDLSGKPTLATVATTGAYADLSGKPVAYSLPTATTSVLGGVKVDGTTITITGGVISGSSSYSLPTASTSVLGGVKVDGTTITINGSGVISGANTYSLPTASGSVLGGVKVGAGLSIDGAGVLSATGAVASVAGRTGAVVLTASDVGGLSAVATAGTFASLTSKPTTLAGYGIVDAAAAAPVQSVAGRTGAVVLTQADVGTTGIPYDLVFPVFGVPASGEVVFRFLAPRAFTIPANMAGSQVKSSVAATGSSVWVIQKNGVQVATATFSASATVASLSVQAAVSVTVGDKISVVAPASVDATLADIDFSIVASLA